VTEKNLRPRFLGSQACKDCHAKEYEKWDDTAHRGAYESLVQEATFPSNRQYDAECVVCHTVGFGYKSGFRDNDSGYINADKSKHLFGVGCEDCHGAGSLHAKNPQDAQLRLAISPWKKNANDHLTRQAIETDKLTDNDPKKMAVSAAEKEVALKVYITCTKCHDVDNDHSYRLDKWLKIAHGNQWTRKK
jgi:hypothetical protein